MRTALLLLLLLAIAAVPGSILPQRGIDAARVVTYLDQHRTLGPWLDRLGFFDVYASPGSPRSTCCCSCRWSAACCPARGSTGTPCAPSPRARRGASSGCPSTPSSRSRRPSRRRVQAAREALRGRRFRVRKGADGEDPHALSGESGYLRETGNLVFHAALIVVIVGVAVGHLFGWRGDVIVPVGDTFSNTLSAYDTLSPGPWVDTEELTPFSVTIDKLDVDASRSGPAARSSARPATSPPHTTTTDAPGCARAPQTRRSTTRSTFGGASVFLLGNGYAPVVTVRDAKGTVALQRATPFLPQDNDYTVGGRDQGRRGAARRSSAFSGFFLPTAEPTFANGPRSLFPDEEPGAGAVGVGGRPVPRQPAAVGLHPRHRPPDPAHQGRREAAADPPRARARPSSCPAAGVDHLRQGGAGSRALGPVRPGQDLTLVAAIATLARPDGLAAGPAAAHLRSGRPGARRRGRPGDPARVPS